MRLSLLRGRRYRDPETTAGGTASATACSVAPTSRAPYAGVTGRSCSRAGARVLPAPPIGVDNPNVLVEAVKLADDRSGDLVVRLYKLRGGRATAHVEFADPGEVAVCDLLERDLPEVAALAPLGQVPGGCSSDVAPFQVVIRSSACLRAAG